MLLAFDVGNTNTVIGVFNENELLTNWRIRTENGKSADEYGMTLNQLFAYEGFKTSDISAIIISTVVPSVLFTLQHLSSKYFKTRALVVAPGIETGLSVKYEDPGQVGADRIVNGIAAYEIYGGPVIIIDFGTATTFCAISDKAEYLGGTIAPGLKITLDAIVEKTARLPKVELEDPGMVICKNTIKSMQSGLVYGHMGTVDYILRKMKSELEEVTTSGKPIKVVATGGLATLIEGGVPGINCIDKLLTLKGLKIIFEKNKNNRRL